MRNFLILLIVIFTTNITKAQSNETETAKKLGLVSYLTTVKSLAEFKMLTLTNDSKYKEIQNASKIQTFNSKYNLLKLYTDQLINQLSADLYNHNNLKAYRSLNNYLKSDKSLAVKYTYYENLIKQIDGLFLTFLMVNYGSLLSSPTLDEYTGVAGAILGIITSDRDFREKKIQSITALLKELKLQNIGDLIKTKEKKD
jgi:hypothetical protein